ncbi:hypothetical protein N7495_002779 [Penicillium taxi]|uniref:uncharacterized protein n=1 Tax=Penicillium taxi TaxID=168475 RepID=UPI0025453F61|nr:uncharacterized protein N7495_002779 [Penicillium taxi]KAJ5902251.1 hypothetical protein N7495_002779 [Penicillium taxi]
MMIYPIAGKAIFLELTEARFYAAQIFCVDCLDNLNILYGRLKPQNVFIDLTDYLFLGEFDLYVRNTSGNRSPWPQPPYGNVKKLDQQYVDDCLTLDLLAIQGNGSMSMIV